jgi:putative intracellular protease/amidase
MRILMIVVPGERDNELFTLEQMIEPYFRFRDSGAEVVFASPGGGQPISLSPEGMLSASVLRFRKDHFAREALTDTLCLNQVFAEDFQAAYCIGAPEILASSADHPASRLIGGLLALGRPVAMVSSGAGEGLMITGSSPLLAARALLGTLRL